MNFELLCMPLRESYYHKFPLHLSETYHLFMQNFHHYFLILKIHHLWNRNFYVGHLSAITSVWYYF